MANLTQLITNPSLTTQLEYLKTVLPVTEGNQIIGFEPLTDDNQTKWLDFWFPENPSELSNGWYRYFDYNIMAHGPVVSPQVGDGVIGFTRQDVMFYKTATGRRVEFGKPDL